VAGVLEAFVIARNTESGSTLPYLLRIPLGDGISLKAKNTWPRTGKVYCHRAEVWPDDAEIVERVAVHRAYGEALPSTSYSIVAARTAPRSSSPTPAADR
jgi:hypothetical protein